MKNISPSTHNLTLQERMPHDSIHNSYNTSSISLDTWSHQDIPSVLHIFAKYTLNAMLKYNDGHLMVYDGENASALWWYNETCQKVSEFQLNI